MKKSTNKELVEELTALNVNGKYDHIIKEAMDGEYHDFKNEKYVCGKVQLVNELSLFPELSSIRAAVIDGKYDESPDEEDKKKMRQEIIENTSPEKVDAFLKMLGL